MALTGVIFRGVHSHIAIIDYSIPLHTTAYLIISLKPIVAPLQKFYQQSTMNQILCTKEFEAALFEILRIKVLN